MKIIRLFGFTLALLILALAHVLPAPAQSVDDQPVKYWIFLSDKVDATGKATVMEADHLTDRALQRRQKRGTRRAAVMDAPLSPVYLAELYLLDVEPVIKSRWLNAVSAPLTEQQAARVRALPFVREVRPVGRLVPHRAPVFTPMPVALPVAPQTTLLEYGASFTQLSTINAIAPLERGINGTGVRIGFLDTEYDGFQHPAFERLVSENRLIDVQNFAGQSQTNRHGRSVVSVAVGFDEGELIGPAYGAEVLAATTEYAPTETNQEEDNFVAGMEWLEAQGADVVNSSLGYSEFDAGEHSYTPADLDGDTGITTRIADWAAALGVVVVTSAGNEGDAPWRFITTPADGDSVIAVGAVSSDGVLADFSGVGPTADGRIKPDVAAQGRTVYLASNTTGYSFRNGTSFSSPIVAGVVAQILQVNPDLNPIEVRDILRATASQSAAPDNFMGWGVIDADAAIRMAEQRTTSTETTSALPERIAVSPPYPNPFSDETRLEVTAPARTGFARLSVYDMLGRKVAVPFEGALHPGVNRIVFEASSLPPGLYVYTLEGDHVSQSGKMVLVR